MGFWAYYSPVGIGLLVTLALHETVRAHGPVLPGWAEWPFVVGVGLGVGLLCQLMMIGVQGAFAQVLPVPVGRSIRGRGAVIGGVAMIACVGLAAVTGLLHSEDLRTAAMITGALSLAAGVGALITYIWCWPVAVRDFGRQRL
jgi:hypothetical protein